MKKSAFLNKKYGDIRSVYVFVNTPEQYEDIYRILITGVLIVGFELSRGDDKINEFLTYQLLITRNN
ncbi:hypothetical protein DLL90_15135 [Salmonella enterica subsp. enterica serovar Arechavaleta]|nr:hypothetical protein [Salmonella enterica subsp. enterica serovar Arechavaleta]EBI3941901.1 hypothetical protein [Salmonella enterica]EBL2098522.1 hypothetical protein [Salmonella enterica]EBO6756601.1 hypothetical protein [Salmonella enterica]EBS0916906.1 hypothetical protein [Salmonella enterica subsp. enterica serovar Arechavaleta]